MVKARGKCQARARKEGCAQAISDGTLGIPEIERSIWAVRAACAILSVTEPHGRHLLGAGERGGRTVGICCVRGDEGRAERGGGQLGRLRVWVRRGSRAAQRALRRAVRLSCGLGAVLNAGGFLSRTKRFRSQLLGLRVANKAAERSGCENRGCCFLFFSVFFVRPSVCPKRRTRFGRCAGGETSELFSGDLSRRCSVLKECREAHAGAAGGKAALCWLCSAPRAFCRGSALEEHGAVRGSGSTTPLAAGERRRC